MKRTNHRGFSLVEVLVAAVIVALSVVSVVGFVRKGQEQVAIDKHRRMARAVIERQFQQLKYSPANYPNLLLNTSSTLSPSPVIDAALSITGTLTTTISVEQTKTVNSIAIPYCDVTMTMSWTELGGRSETITIDKWIAYGLSQ